MHFDWSLSSENALHPSAACLSHGHKQWWPLLCRWGSRGEMLQWPYHKAWSYSSEAKRGAMATVVAVPLQWLCLAFLIHSFMREISMARACCTDLGSKGFRLRRSRWWAPSGITTATRELVMFWVTPPADHGSRPPLLKMILLCELMFFPPYIERIQERRGLTPHILKHSSENASKSHFWGSNMSWTPSVHKGITISVQAW